MPHTLTRSSHLRLIVLCLFVSFASSQVDAHETNSRPRVSVIPQPRELTSTGESFRDFIDDVKQTAGVSIKTNRRHGRSTILVGLLTLPSIQSALKSAAVAVPANLDEEGYVLIAGTNGVVVAGRTPAGVFYGLQTLKQLVRGDSSNASIQGVRVVDWPAMRWRGVSDDISRGPVPTVNYIKRQLRTFAAFKLNMHSFYMEHIFASTEHPLIGPTGGALTPEEIRDLVAYARSYHIELVPEQQTFGHLHKALKLEKYNELAETPYGDVLSPQQEGTYKLIADWYRELNELFPGKFFHIGEDETFELGEGQSREAARARGVGAIYFEHLNRVRNLLKPYNRRLMFWGDIALNHPDLIGKIPKEMIVMNWDYAPKDDFTERIKPFKDAGLDEFVCPGAGGWNQIFPNVDSSSKNIVNFVRDGQTAGALGMMNTTWDDDGESLFEMSWYGIVLGAAASWQQQAVDTKNFDADFDWAFFRNEGDHFVSAIHTLGGVNSVLGIRSSDDLFWRDPFTSSFQVQVRASAEKTRQMRLQVEDAEEALLLNRQKARRNASMISGMIFAAQRFDHLGRRSETVEKLSREYWDAYLNLGDRVKARRLRRYTAAIYNSLREMAEELVALRSSYKEQWLAENRPYWLDSVLARYDQAIALWLNKSRTLDELLRTYEATSVLPNPEEFGLGPRVLITPTPRP